MRLPKLDNRDKENLIEEFKDLAKHYTPEWLFSMQNPDAGAALTKGVLNLLKGTIDRYNQVLLKNQMEFLNLIDSSIMPAQSSKCPLVFNLSVGAKHGILVSQGTQVYAVVDEEEIVFETNKSIYAVNSQINDIFYMNGKRDYIKKFSQDLFDSNQINKAFEGEYLFDNNYKNLQEHCIFLGDKELFDINGKANIYLRFENDQKFNKSNYFNKLLADKKIIDWYYYTEKEWKKFDDFYYEGESIKLIKTNRDKIQICKIDENQSRYIKGRLNENIKSEVFDIDINKICISLNSNLENNEIIPEKIFYDDIELDNQGFYPFSENYAVYDTFYIKNDEVFSKKDSFLSINFEMNIKKKKINPIDEKINWKLIMKASQMEEPKEVYTKIKEVIWEYWDGKAWRKLFYSESYNELFFKEKDEDIRINFKCPKDIQKNFVNGYLGYWIRIKVIRIENNFLPNTIWCIPYIRNLTFSYDYRDKYVDLSRIITLNNLTFKDYSNNAYLNNSQFCIFEKLNSNSDDFYICFSDSFDKGPISLYFDLKNNSYNEDNKMNIYWNYLRKKEDKHIWENIKIIDGTNNMSNSGSVLFSLKDKLDKIELFGIQGYWIRISVYKEDKVGEINNLFINGIYMNCIEATQQETVKKEYLNASIQEDSIKFYLNNFPVIEEEVWINEISILSIDELNAIQKNLTRDIIIERDPYGIIKSCWVKWKSVDDFYSSTENDRHYLINRMKGIIMFGDGINGKRSPLSISNSIYVNYRIGGGKKGNVRAYSANKFRESIAFLESVYNPIHAAGGCDNEEIKDALKRKSAFLKHRDRAVTYEDFENLAKEASRNIAKVKCLSNIDRYGKTKLGNVTLVVMPNGNFNNTNIMNDLFIDIKSYILKRSSNLLYLNNQLHVISPFYIKVFVRVNIYIKDMSEIIRTEKEAKDIVIKFLDPLKGNYDNKGWDIGNLPHESMFYSLLNKIEGVVNIENISIEFRYMKNKIEEVILEDEIKKMPHILITNGEHQIHVDLSES